MAGTSQLGLAQLGLAHLGAVGTSDGLLVTDTATLAESVSVSVIGDPWLLEASVSDAVSVAESRSWTVDAALSVSDAISAAESVVVASSGARGSAFMLLGVG